VRLQTGQNPGVSEAQVLRNCRAACGAMGIVLWAGAASVQAQSNLDAGKSPAQIFSDTCNACHRSPREIKRTSPAFLREHYTTGPREAAVMAAYLASVGSDPHAVQQRRPPTMGAGQAPAETATARAPAAAPQGTDQSKSDTQAALPATTAPATAEQAKPAAAGVRRPSESVEFGVPLSWATAAGGTQAASPQTAAMPPKRYPGQDFEE
jgi:hypothetical protein